MNSGSVHLNNVAISAAPVAGARELLITLKKKTKKKKKGAAF